MNIEKHLKSFGEFLSTLKTRLTQGQYSKARAILEDLINDLNYVYSSRERLEMELKGLKNQDYASTFQKAMDIIMLMGFDLIDFTDRFNRQSIEFMACNIESIKKSGPLTAERITNIAIIIRYHEQTTGEFPESMGDVVKTFNSLVDIKSTDQKFFTAEDIAGMTAEQITTIYEQYKKD